MFDEAWRCLKILAKAQHEWSIWARLEQNTWDKNEKDVNDSNSIGRMDISSEGDTRNKSRKIQHKLSWTFFKNNCTWRFKVVHKVCVSRLWFFTKNLY